MVITELSEGLIVTMLKVKYMPMVTLHACLKVTVTVGLVEMQIHWDISKLLELGLDEAQNGHT
jgi:hypothetical protein